MKKCCGNCFGDFFLSREIELIGDGIGRCEYCGSTTHTMVDPTQLRDRFDVFWGLYEESTHATATSIEILLRNDWSLFENIDSIKALTLLVLIFDNKDLFHKKYLPIEKKDDNAVQEWGVFREELKHCNRFFPKNIQATKQLRELFGFLSVRPEEIPDKVYRARTCEKSDPYPIEKMGKPPKEVVGNGRANPVGIPCLYVASDPATALSEIRPHKGEVISVAEFEVNGTLMLADLRDPRKSISPFVVDDEGKVKLLSQYMGYLCRLGEELTMPVIPKAAHLEYLPSQYLCEFIKDCGFDGVIYKSAMGPGVNYAIFNDVNLVGNYVQQYRIDNIHVTHSVVGGTV